MKTFFYKVDVVYSGKAFELSYECAGAQGIDFDRFNLLTYFQGCQSESERSDFRSCTEVRIQILTSGRSLKINMSNI